MPTAHAPCGLPLDPPLPRPLPELAARRSSAIPRPVVVAVGEDRNPKPTERPGAPPTAKNRKGVERLRIEQRRNRRTYPPERDSGAGSPPPGQPLAPRG